MRRLQHLAFALLGVAALAVQSAASAQSEQLQAGGLEWLPRRLLATVTKPPPDKSARARLRDKRIEVGVPV